MLKQHGSTCSSRLIDTSNVSSRDVTCQVEFGPMATKCGAILCYFLNYLLLPWYTLGDTFELVNFIMWRLFLKKCDNPVSSVQTRRRKLVMYSCLHGQSPRYLTDLCLPVSGVFSTPASSIRTYSASLGGSAMPAQHTRSTGVLCGRPVASELSTSQLYNAMTV